MFAPAMLPSGAKLILTNFSNWLELFFLWVCALPSAPRMGLACNIWRSRSPRRQFVVNRSGEPDRPLRLLCVRLRPELNEPEVDRRLGECVCELRTPVAIAARCRMTFFVFSVFPAPDSLVMRMLWFSHARSVTAKMCDRFSSRRFPRYYYLTFSSRRERVRSLSAEPLNPDGGRIKPVRRLRGASLFSVDALAYAFVSRSTIRTLSSFTSFSRFA